MPIPRGILPLVLVLLLLAAGCRSKPPSPQYDSAAAEQTLVLVLEAWKQGRVAALADRDLPIRFEDEDYRGGCRLLDYRLERSDQRLRPFEDVPVVLVLRDRKGKVREKPVVYQITLEPEPAVLRND